MNLLIILLLIGGNYDDTYIQEVEVKEQRTEVVQEDNDGGLRYAKVSWYDESYCRKHNPTCITASGVRFDERAFTCACSNNYPFGTMFRFTYGNNTVVARCTDRGSFKEKYNRDFDLSKATFEALAPLSKGVITVKLEEK